MTMEPFQHYITVKVEPGMFESERGVSFEAEGQHYHLLVDFADLDGDRLKVEVIDHESNYYLVRLPRETFTTGATLKLPKALVNPTGIQT